MIRDKSHYSAFPNKSIIFLRPVRKPVKMALRLISSILYYSIINLSYKILQLIANQRRIPRKMFLDSTAKLCHIVATKKIVFPTPGK